MSRMSRRARPESSLGQTARGRRVPVGAGRRRLPHGILCLLTDHLLPTRSHRIRSGPRSRTCAVIPSPCSGRTDRGRQGPRSGPSPRTPVIGCTFGPDGPAGTHHGRDHRPDRTGEPRRPHLGTARLRPGVRGPAVERRRRRRYGCSHAGPPPERGRAPGPGETAHRRRRLRRRTPRGTTAGGPGDRPHRQPVHEYRLRGRPALEAMDERWTERLDAMDRRWAERFEGTERRHAALNDRFDVLDGRFDDLYRHLLDAPPRTARPGAPAARQESAP